MPSHSTIQYAAKKPAFSNPHPLLTANKNIKIIVLAIYLRPFFLSESNHTCPCQRRCHSTWLHIPHINSAVGRSSNLTAFQAVCDPSLSGTHGWISSSGAPDWSQAAPAPPTRWVWHRTAQPAARAGLETAPNGITVGSGREN